jgi:hypothetical protein
LDESQGKSGAFGLIAKFKMPRGPKMFCAPAMQWVRIIARREDFGVRWQGAAATPLWNAGQHCKSGVALRFPPHSKKFGCGLAALSLRGKFHGSK